MLTLLLIFSPQRAQWGDEEEEEVDDFEQGHQQDSHLPGVEMDMTTSLELDKYDDGEDEVSEVETKVRFSSLISE